MRIALELIKNNFNIYKNRKVQNYNKVNLTYPKDTFTLTNPEVAFGAACSEGNFKIKEIKNLRCPVCDKIMLNPSEMEDFASKVSTKTGQDLVDALDTYGDEEYYTQNRPEGEIETEEEIRRDGSPRTIYRTQAQKIVDIIKEMALKNPNLTLAEIVHIKAGECIGELIVQQMDVVRKLESYLETVELEQNERESVNYVIQIYKNQILGKNQERFRRQRFIHDLRNIVENEEIQNKIIEIISELPNSANSIDSFFVKWGLSTTSSKEIAYNLIYDARPTAEHIIPKSQKGGKNDTSNYICDCAYCNTERGDMDFALWAPTIPNFQENLQYYLARVARCVDDEKLEYVYDSYVETMIKVLDKRSNGFIKLKTPILQNSTTQRQAERKKQRALERARQTNMEIGIHISELEAQVDELERYPSCDEINLLESMKERLKKLAEKISKYQDRLASEETKMASIIRVKRKLTQLNVSLSKISKNAPYSPYEEKEEEIKELEKELKEMDEAKVSAEIERIKAKIEDYESRVEDLSTSIKTATKASKEFLISIRTEELTPIMEKSGAILAKLSSLGGQVAAENGLIERAKELKEENTRLERENEVILESLGSTPVKNGRYNSYLHYIELLDEIEGIKDQKRNRKNKNLIEIVDIANNTIGELIDELAHQADVRYFINLDVILENKKELEQIAKRLSAIADTKIKMVELEKELAEVNGDKTYEENCEEYEGLLSEREFIAKVKDLPQLKARIQALNTTYKYNAATLKHLSENPDIPDYRFYELIKRIQASDILKQPDLGES